MKKVIIRALSFICIVSIVVCIILLVTNIRKYQSENSYYNNISNKAENNSEIDFDMLRKENAEVIGWIKIADTKINYPIVQGEDNSKYLYTLFNGEQGGSGCIFADYRNNAFRGPLTIVYGHRMKYGSMFNNIKYFKDSSFANEHKSITLYTPERKYDCKIVLFATINATNKVYNMKFDSAIDVYKMLKNKSVYKINDVSREDKLILLSTCTYEFDNARYVLLAKL